MDWPLSEVGTGLEQQICYIPHRLIIWSCLPGPETEHTHTHTLVLASIDGLHSTTDLIFQRGHLSAVSQQPWFWYL